MLADERTDAVPLRGPLRWGVPLQELMIAALRTPAGSLISRPWFDRLALKVLSAWFFPSSRLWAAARAAEGSVERFFAEVPMKPEARLVDPLVKRLVAFERARLAAANCEVCWENAFFGTGQWDDHERAQTEQRRLINRNTYNLHRRLFLTLGLTSRIDAIRWNVPSPEDVETLYGALAGDPARAFAVPNPMPAVTVSKAIRHDNGSAFWVRFNSPASRMADQITARVHAPEGVKDPPTLIWGHGICVEFDHWRGQIDEVEKLVAMGVRVVRPEAPWHGRRVPPGMYGGEKFMATAPLGAIDLFTSAAREWAVLMDWCRSTTSGPVCIGGSSLGAMTAQLTATKAHTWPNRLRPDAMLLITHCGHLEDAVVRGSLARVWGIEEATEAHGWTRELMQRYLPLIDCVGRPVMAPENIVTVLGAVDDVTPFPSAKVLIGEWGIPQENAFISRRGHFSVPLAMVRDHAPIRRFRDVLDGLS